MVEIKQVSGLFKTDGKGVGQKIADVALAFSGIDERGHMAPKLPHGFVVIGQCLRVGFDKGWDQWREEIFARQLSQGIVPEGTVLTPRPTWLPRPGSPS